MQIIIISRLKSLKKVKLQSLGGLRAEPEIPDQNEKK
jgi:hypothetical protein